MILLLIVTNAIHGHVDDEASFFSTGTVLHVVPVLFEYRYRSSKTNDK
eukprot:COSAG02_NODE_459_length_21908_cov_5.444725_4_plen_48_part_00